MAVLPQIPVFELGDYHLWRLQQLSAAVAFACRAPVIFHLYKTGSQSISATTLTAVSWDAASADSDGGWSSGNKTRYTAQTPGYFHCDFGASCPTSATDGDWIVGLRVTTGANNPGGAGTATVVGARSDDMGGVTGFQQGLAASVTSPYLYIGDYLEVVVFCSQAVTLTAPWNSSGNNDENGFPDGSPSFTGMLVSLGTWNNGTWGP